jgi:hypothetical protein
VEVAKKELVAVSQMVAEVKVLLEQHRISDNADHFQTLKIRNLDILPLNNHLFYLDLSQYFSLL